METSKHAELRRRYETQRQDLLKPADPAFLKTLDLFAGVPEKARDKVVEKVAKFMNIVTYEPDELVLEEGSYNDSAYYIVNGAVEIVLTRVGDGALAPRIRGGAHVAPPPHAVPKAVPGMLGRGQGTSGTLILEALPAAVTPGRRKILEAGEIFGEISALSRYAVSASVKAVAPTRLVRIQLRGLKTLAMTSKEFKKWLDQRYRERALATHLKSVSLFDNVSDSLIEGLKQKVDLVSYETGQIIAQEGTPADAFLLVRGGFVKVSVRTGTSELAVTYLRKGDFAGEVALLLEETWPFTLQALESVEVVKLSKEDFQTVLRQYPPVEDQLWAEAVARLKARGAVSRNPISSGYMQMAMDTGLIHGESVLLIDLSTCTRCDECVRGCADAHGGEPRFLREGYRYRNWLVPTACYQCTDPTCMVDCPTGAITREFEALVVTINGTEHATRPCIGCGNCAQRCPWGNIVMVERGLRPDGKPQEAATKCDLCYTRNQGPACVQMCPHGSAVRLSFRDVDRVVQALQ